MRILGPLEVTSDGGMAGAPGGKAGLLLAALVLHANQVVSADRLSEFLWRGRPPDTAAGTLRPAFRTRGATSDLAAHRASWAGW
jgi:DNA-binding SARP family transcriptional activator